MVNRLPHNATKPVVWSFRFRAAASVETCSVPLLTSIANCGKETAFKTEA